MRYRPGALLIVWLECAHCDRTDLQRYHLWTIFPPNERYHALL